MRLGTALQRTIPALLAFLLVAPAALHAEEVVAFRSAGTAPTPFQIQRAKAQGKTLEPTPGAPIRGVLFRPEGEGPFPAIVLLHDCRGIRAYLKGWARELAARGYVALLVDSYGPRKLTDICAEYLALRYSDAVGGRVADAFGAHAYLRSLPFVDPARIAAMGWTDTALSVVHNKGASRDFDGTFRAAVAIHPECPPSWGEDFGAPVLVLIGEGDDAAKPEYCQRMAAASRGRPAEVEVVLYPGALHGFDDPDAGERTYVANAYNPNKEPAFGVTLGYSAAAHADARSRVEAFLARHLE